MCIQCAFSALATRGLCAAVLVDAPKRPHRCGKFRVSANGIVVSAAIPRAPLLLAWPMCATRLTRERPPVFSASGWCCEPQCSAKPACDSGVRPVSRGRAGYSSIRCDARHVQPLRRGGMSRGRAFFWGQLSAVVEPVAGVIGAAPVLVSGAVLPYGMAFAGGAMLYVVVEELIPGHRCCSQWYDRPRDAWVHPWLRRDDGARQCSG